MEESKNKDFAFFYSKVGRIWKSSEKTPPEVTVHLLVKQCITGQFIGAGIEHAEEFLSKPTGLLFVPRIPSNDIFLDFGKEAQIVCHFLRSILD
jgi:hypothetical protein